MNNCKGITLVSLVITIIVLLILAGTSIAIVFGESGMLNETKREEIMKTQENCKHEWVTTSTYDYFRESYKTISKCSVCGKEV